MAGRMIMLVGCTLIVAAMLQCIEAQTTHVVGEELGWLVPLGGPSAYSTWAGNQTFKVGDILVFNFVNGTHDVAKVTKEAFDACTTNSTIGSIITISPARITLDTEGEHYFISTYPRQCSLGQKLAITVIATSTPPSSTPSPVPSPTPVQPTTHVVGNSLGWLVPPGGPVAYSAWADTQTFRVGDILVFNFVNGTHDVAKVTKEVFDACNTSSTIGSIITTSPARITLNSEGKHYFISTYPRQCLLGQKLAINVTASSGTPPSTAPPPVPAPTPTGPTTHVVGDTLGWLVPPAGSIAYETWASTHIFRVDDTLLFNFINGSQDVAELTKEAFNSCNMTTTIGPVLTTSPARIILQSGEHYYTSTIDRHCSLGQKLAINVTSSATPPSSTATPPPSIATPPSGTATPPTPSTLPPPPTTGGPPPPSSASSLAMASFSVTFLYLAVAFLF